jgi:multidrug efflux system outer membrane protein
MLKLALTTVAFAAALSFGPASAQEPLTGPAPAATQAEAGLPWWAALHDPVLSRLIEQGLAANLDLAQAAERLARSRALQRGAEAEFGPSGSIGARGRAVQASESEAPGLARADRRGHQVQAGLDFSWEIDLFGRIGAAAGAAAQRTLASGAQLDGVRLAVSAEIAQAWFALAGAREQLSLAQDVAANRRGTLALVQSRVRHGHSALLDEARAQADLEAALADIPVHEAAARVATHRLAVLLGVSPQGFTAPLASAAQPAALALRVDDAGQWLARRPDLREREALLRAQALDADAIRAELFPRLTLTGVIGFVAGSASAIGSGGTLSWLSAPSLLAPLLDRPRIQARHAAAKAGQREALAAYQQRALLATEEVENALARHAAVQRELEALQRRAQHAATAERLAKTRYGAGAADLLELLDAQRTAQQASAALAGALTRQRLHVVEVFRGLGGPA